MLLGNVLRRNGTQSGQRKWPRVMNELMLSGIKIKLQWRCFSKWPKRDLVNVSATVFFDGIKNLADDIIQQLVDIEM